MTRPKLLNLRHPRRKRPNNGGGNARHSLLGRWRRISLAELPPARARNGAGGRSLPVAQGGGDRLAHAVGEEPPPLQRALLDRRGAAQGDGLTGLWRRRLSPAPAR